MKIKKLLLIIKKLLLIIWRLLLIIKRHLLDKVNLLRKGVL